MPLPNAESRPTTRLAPSPTGALHLGNARTFLANWAVARQRGWRIVLRIEDLDGPRVKPGAAELAVETLAWLGIDWDEGPFDQRSDTTPYTEALARLATEGRVYPCRCTRSQLLAPVLSAPNAGDHELRYPGNCRPDAPAPIDYPDAAPPNAAWRFRTPDAEVVFQDAFAGRQSFNPQQMVGDFVVATKVGLPSYQLAVVVDDARQGVTEVFRGDDLLPSTPRQLLLQQSLELTKPSYTHLPMVIGEDGRRLAKRHGDTRVDSYRRAGVPPERVIGLIANWCGAAERRPMSAKELQATLRLEEVPKHAVTFRGSDDAWLRDG